MYNAMVGMSKVILIAVLLSDLGLFVREDWVVAPSLLVRPTVSISYSLESVRFSEWHSMTLTVLKDIRLVGLYPMKGLSSVVRPQFRFEFHQVKSHRCILSSSFLFWLRLIVSFIHFKSL